VGGEEEEPNIVVSEIIGARGRISRRQGVAWILNAITFYSEV